MKINDRIRLFIIEQLRELGENGDEESLKDDTPLIENGIIDSMMILNLLAFMEQNFGILLPKGKFNPEDFATIQKISDYVGKKLAHG